MKVMEISSQQRSFSANCFCIMGDQGSCAIIDPGAKGDEIATICKQNDLVVTHILLTHGHYDHIGGASELKKAYPDAILIACEKEADIIGDPTKNLVDQAMSSFDKEMYSLTADRLVTEGDEILIDGETITVMETPGHTKGSVCFLVGDDMFTGDTLFFNNHGRTDLYSSDQRTMITSLLKFDAIPDHVRVFPGHEQSCTMADNRAFLQSIKRQRG